MWRKTLSLTLLLFTAFNAQGQVIRIYQDADISHHYESSYAIQKGIELAFSEIGNEIQGHRVEFEYLDHRANVVRSKSNFDRFLADSEALAIYSGIHSPPLISNRDFINESKALTLVPWAAGAPITRYPSTENWIFRLSVDDTKAGAALIKFALDDKECRSPHLLLESTPWGDSNLTNMSKALKSYGVENPSVTRFGWNMSDQRARITLREIVSSGADCIVLVANAIEGIVMTNALIDIGAATSIPLISHWGITGGNFHESIDTEKRKGLDLSFIQTCFMFTNSEQNSLSKQVFNQLRELTSGVINEPEDLRAAVGLIHAYDLTKVLIAAIEQAGLSGDITTDRNNIRLALENLKAPIPGLVKNYEGPFSVFDSETNFDAHEALGSEDLCMATYGQQDEILIIE